MLIFFLPPRKTAGVFFTFLTFTGVVGKNDKSLMRVSSTGPASDSWHVFFCGKGHKKGVKVAKVPVFFPVDGRMVINPYKYIYI